MGQAFKIRFRDYENKSELQDVQNFIGWSYGHNIISDPMVTLIEAPPVVPTGWRGKGIRKGHRYPAMTRLSSVRAKPLLIWVIDPLLMNLNYLERGLR